MHFSGEGENYYKMFKNGLYLPFLVLTRGNLGKASSWGIYPNPVLSLVTFFTIFSSSLQVLTSLEYPLTNTNLLAQNVCSDLLILCHSVIIINCLVQYCSFFMHFFQTNLFFNKSC